MKRATTPRHIFILPIDASTVSVFQLTYAQNGKTVLEKGIDDMTVSGNEWSIVLTQEEANLFKSDYANVQIRVLTTDNKVMASDIFRINVGPVLNDEVLT